MSVGVVTADSTEIGHADIAGGVLKVSWEREELHDHLGDLTRLDRLHKGQSPCITKAQTATRRTRNGPGPKRMLIENELDAYIGGFSLNALSSNVSLNVDLDTTLTVVAGNLYRLFARNLPRYQHATPTPCGGISSTTPAPCASPPTASPLTSPCAATIPCSSMPASSTSNYPPPGGTAGPYASASHPANPQHSTNLNQISAPKIEVSPREVFLALVCGVAEGRWDELPNLCAEQTHVVHPFDPLRSAALRTRDELREHFRPTDTGPRLHRRPANITIHETTDPEVIVAEFEYQGTVADTGEPFAVPGIFVLRVRNGQIVSSRDYFDHVTAARIRGQLDTLVAAVSAGTTSTPTDTAT